MVIPARLESRRVFRKALAPIGGIPLVEHVRRRAVQADVGPVWVATDSDAIEAAVTGFGGAVIRTGPALNGTHRVGEAAEAIEADAFLNVQGDQPLLDPESVRALAGRVGSAAIATIAAPLPVEAQADPARVKVWIRDGWATDFSREHRPNARLHVGLYGFTREALRRVISLPIGARARAEGLEQLTWLEAGLPVGVELVGATASAVDTPEHLERVRQRWQGKG